MIVCSHSFILDPKKGPKNNRFFRTSKLVVGKFENQLANVRSNLEMKSNWFWLRPMRLQDLKLSPTIMVPKQKVWLVNSYHEDCCFPMMRRLYWMATKLFQSLKIKMATVITLMTTQWSSWEEDIMIISTKYCHPMALSLPHKYCQPMTMEWQRILHRLHPSSNMLF